MDRKLPAWLRVDPERGFILAYYEWVQGTTPATLNSSPTREIPFVAWAANENTYYAMNFSTYYDDSMKLSTIQRRLSEATKILAGLAWLPELTPKYEIWCFIEPSPKLLRVVDDTYESPIALVSPQQVVERLRDTIRHTPSEDWDDAGTGFANTLKFIKSIYPAILDK